MSVYDHYGTLKMWKYYKLSNIYKKLVQWLIFSQINCIFNKLTQKVNKFYMINATLEILQVYYHYHIALYASITSYFNRYFVSFSMSKIFGPWKKKDVHCWMIWKLIIFNISALADFPTCLKYERVANEKQCSKSKFGTIWMMNTIQSIIHPKC